MTEMTADPPAPVVPSGMALSLQEILHDTQAAAGLTMRFRFVAPDLAVRRGVEDGAVLLRDIEHLCNAYALPQLAGAQPMPGQIVISVSEMETEFGTANPEVVQVFEGFRLENGVCIWEPF